MILASALETIDENFLEPLPSELNRINTCATNYIEYGASSFNNTFRKLVYKTQPLSVLPQIKRH